MRARKAPASPLPPSAEGRITRLAAVHVKAVCDVKSVLVRAGLSPKNIDRAPLKVSITGVQRSSLRAQASLT